MKRIYKFGMTVLLLGIPGVFVFQNCDQVKLSIVQPTLIVKPSGKLCAQPPPNFQEAHRFMFFIDNSGSVQGLDPATPAQPSKRVQALRDFIGRFTTDDNFSIAVGSLYDRQAGYLPDPTNPVAPNIPRPQANCNFYKPRVQADMTNLSLAMDQLDTHALMPFGNTPFLNVMDEFQSCLESDVAASNGAKYSVVFVTDGAPTDATAQQMKDAVTKLVNTAKPPGNKFSNLNVFLLFLDNFNSSPDAANLINQTIQAAVTAGAIRSKAIMLDTTKAFDYSVLGLFDIPKYRLKQLLVTNLNAGIEDDGTLGPDSDADGITDKRELGFGTDPTNPSTKGQCSDLIWVRNGGRCPSTCPEGLRFLDSDHDGLSDCDEMIIGTNPHEMDTDGDGIIDSMEYVLGLSAIDPADADADPDGDGVSNRQEAIRGTSPFIDDRTVNHKAILDVSIKETNDQGTYCYDVAISGLQVFPTLEVKNHPLIYLNHGAGENIIRLLFFEVPEDQPGATPLVLESYRSVIYKKTDTGVLKGLNDITDADFSFVDQ